MKEEIVTSIKHSVREVVQESDDRGGGLFVEVRNLSYKWAIFSSATNWVALFYPTKYLRFETEAKTHVPSRRHT
jgi:hypothetical protein